METVLLCPREREKSEKKRYIYEALYDLGSLLVFAYERIKKYCTQLTRIKCVQSVKII